MYQRVVSLVLLPCVLMTQSAALGHSHGGQQPAGHDLRPHFHTSSSGAGHAHEHHHHGSHGHHHRHDAGDDVAAPDVAPVPLSQHEHDSDAVYVNRIDAVINQRPAVSDASGGLPHWGAVALSDPGDVWANPAHQTANWMHAPAPSAHAGPLYIWQRALLV